MPGCKSCGAPISAGTATCAYCGTVNDVDLRRVSDYTERAPESARSCPACGVPMAVIDVSASPGERFLVERCDKCLGLFFDAGELEAVLEASVSHAYQIDFARLGELQQPAARDAVAYRRCPVCGKMMNRVNYGARSGVITDQCHSHGLWLQAGELSRLLDWRKSGGLLYHEQIAKEKERAAQEVERERQERLEKLLREAAAYDRG